MGEPPVNRPRDAVRDVKETAASVLGQGTAAPAPTTSGEGRGAPPLDDPQE